MKISEVQAFCKDKLNLKLDRWQKELILEEDKHIVIRAGRQVGKSTGVALKAFFYAREHEKKTLLVVAASQRQASLLFEKIVSMFIETDYDAVQEEPTKTKIILKNGSTIYCVPAGRSGYSIRGYSIDLLIADEAAFIGESVWLALTPMLAVTKGKIILLSTPFGKGGYYYECFGDSDFRQFHLSSVECPRIPNSFIEKEKKRMSKMEFAQEYLGNFIDEFRQYFPTSLIKDCAMLPRWNYTTDYDGIKSYYLGVDVARFGGDENAFVVVEIDKNKKLRCVKVLTTSRISLSDTINRIIKLNELFKFRKVFIDDMGVGAGVTDVLIDKLGNRVIGINNSSRSIDKEGKRKLRILKEDLYSNLLVLMEAYRENIKPCIELIDLPELKRSLASIEFEYTEHKHLRIYGRYSHITEALVRACWGLKTKGLKLFLA